LGVAYKGNIDDTRKSPVLRVIAVLEKAGIGFKIYDLHVTHHYETKNIREAFEDNDCAVVLTDHDEFRFLYPKELAGLMHTSGYLIPGIVWANSYGKQAVLNITCLVQGTWAKK